MSSLLQRTTRRLRPAGIALGLCALSAAGGGAHEVQAAVLVALDLPALVEQSDLVVVASAQEQSSRYVDKLIVTDVTLKVISGLKGQVKPGDLVTVTHLGGAVGDIGLRVPGAASFSLGKSALVFLRRVPSGDLNVTGMSQGVMPIFAEGTQQRVQTGAAGAALMQRNASGELVETHSGPSSRSLSELLAEIERLVKSH
jgi:hypothetical protein